MANFIGQGVFRCSHPIPILATAAIAGEKEGQGPMSACFDRICSDSYFGQTTWEQAEGALQRETASLPATWSINVPAVPMDCEG